MKVSKTAIFLFELMVVILIFSIAAAVCTSAFGKAYGYSEDSKGLTMAVLKAESIAEEFKAGVLDPDEAKNKNESYSVKQSFDKDWNDADGSGEKAAYELLAQVSESDRGIRICEISVTAIGDAKKPIYGLEVKSYGK
jgi:Tfp pilus assembly protein PilE